MSRALRCCLVAGALLVASLALAACGGGNGSAGKTPTATKPATKAASQQISGTPTAAPTPTPPAATAASAQSSATPVATQAPATQASNTPSAGTGQTIDVSLREFHVTPSIGTASAGTVTFHVSNDGTIPHDFVVIKTDLAQDALPVDQASYVVDESQVDVVTRQPSIHQEDSVQVTVDLTAGQYVLICNLADHYQTGMHAAFAVQ
jgi:uncharacterized cupredoxin-like copper-binding protein